MATAIPECSYMSTGGVGDNVDDFRQSIFCHLHKPSSHTVECIAAYSTPIRAINNQNVHMLCQLIGAMSATNMAVDEYQCQDNGNLTLLQAVVKQHKVNLEMLRMLLVHVNVSTKTASSCPLVTALKIPKAGENHWITIQLLLEHGSNVTLCDSVGEQSLSVYLKSLKDCFDEVNWSSVVDMLLAKGCDINHVDFRGATPLQSFLYFGIPHTGARVKVPKITEKQVLMVINKLLQCGANVQRVDKYGDTLLHSAVSSMNINVCECLIDAGVDGNRNTSGGGNAFFGLWESESCITAKRLDIIDKLIHLLNGKGKIDINMRAPDGSTVIHKAALLSPVKLIEVLIDNGADVALRDGIQNSVLHYAVQNEYDDVLEFFLHMKMLDVNAKNISDLTPLHYAALIDDGVTMTALIEAGADVHAQSQDDAGTLHLAAIIPDVGGDSAESVPILLQNGVDIDMTDTYGCTALYYALFQHNKTYIEALQQSGARRLCPSLDKTDIASSTPYGYIANVALRENWQKPSTKDLVAKGGKLMTLAQLNSHTQMVKKVCETNVWKKSSNITFLNEVVVPVVDPELRENILVRDTVQNFIQSVTETVSQLDPLFKGKLICSGSSYEGVKTHLPNEYDYMVELINFTEMANNIDQSKYAGFVTVTSSDQSLLSPQMRNYTTNDGMLNSNSILTQFKLLLQTALLMTYTRKWKHIMKYPGDMMDTTAPWISDNRNMLINHKLLWTSDSYKLMRISIDVNPVIFINQWPSFCRSSSPLISNINEKGVYLIPKQPTITLPGLPEPDDCKDERLWRLSFSHLETEIICQSKYREALLLAKAMRMQPLSPELTSDPNRKPEAMHVDHLLTSRLQNITDETSSESEESLDLSKDSDEDNVQEVNAEDVIQTYYLKQLFFTVAHERLEDKAELTPVEFTREIYARLLDAIEKSALHSYFVPSQNLYSAPSDLGYVKDQIDSFHSKALLALCRHILSVLLV